MSELVNITQVNAVDFTYQDYSSQDETLIPSFEVSSSFDQSTDTVEFYLYDYNSNIIFLDYNFTDYRVIDNILTINPEQDVLNYVGEDGLYYLTYNFLSNRLNSSADSTYYIKEISADRTELRLDSNIISNLDIVTSTTLFTEEINLTNYKLDFYLNFGANNLVIANNILLDTSSIDDPTVLIKLYEPLPQQFGLKDECWVAIEVSEPLAYEATYQDILDIQEDIIQLKGPNVNLNINDQINNSTDYLSQSNLKTSVTSSYQYQLNSYLAGRGLNINIDYNDFSNFIFFSSAQRRVENFYYKLQLIEEYQVSSSLSGTTPSNTFASSSQDIWQLKIQDILDNFDHYEYYLYYESGSSAFPKTNPVTGPPYINVATNSVSGLAWLTEYLASGSEYDNNNDNYLYNSIPTYINQDIQNEPLELFVDMLAQSFDDTWIYLKDVTNKWDADNRINYGVSKDIVADIIRDLGVKIYQNNFSVANLYEAFLGFDPSGSYTFPYDATGSLPVPANSGLEYVNNYITSSVDAVPLDDVNKRIYKRIYHNLPYLLKTKGTLTGLNTLIGLYGIPNTILRVNEYGGKDKLNVNDWDYWQKIFDYSLNTSTVASAVSSSWGLNSTWSSPNDVPASLQFRFKLPSTGSSGAVTYAVANNDTVLWSLDDGSNVAVVLEYTGSGFASGSYSGSIVDPFYQYGTLKFIADGGTTSASVYLPFYNGDWWSVMVTRDGQDFNLYAANSIYNGFDGAQIGYIASSSLSDATSEANWVGGTVSYFSAQADSISLGGNTYTKTSGSYQEVRYYTTALNVSPFQDYVMNPQSTEGNGVNTTPDTLAFRAALGSELYTSSISIHPKVTGSWVTTSSFASNSNFYIGSGTSFVVNRGYTFYDQPIAGIQNAISNKVKTEALVLPEGDTLSAFRSIQQNSPLTGSYTRNVNYVEVAFSPQNEINEDIMDQIGFLNLGEYIGDPRQVSSSATSYPDLNALRNAYFEKYESNYDINDYVRLIKYFDNSLFKMIQDFVPARSGLAAGVVIKQHLLERNKYPVPQLSQSEELLTGSIETAFITGSTGGTFNQFNGLTNEWQVTQSWTGINVSPLGNVAFTQSNQEEFYNGELSGSDYVVTNGELNEANIYKNPSTVEIQFDIYEYTLNNDGSSTSIGENAFLALSPGVGELFIYNYYGGPLVPIPTYGNKWILISKFDINSIDVTTSIQEISNITFASSVNDAKTFTVISISEKADYFILLLAPDGINYSVLTQGLNVGTFVTVLEPFNSLIFYNSDDNVLFNNSIAARESTHFFGVDYSNGVLIPTNQQAILSGSAVPADIQQYNWYLKRSTLPRYDGSRLFAQNYNTWSLGDESYGKDPVINYNGNVAFDVTFVGGTYPEMILGTALNIIRANIFTSVSQSTIIDQNTPEVFNFMIDQYLGYSQSAQIFSNDVSPIKDNNIQTVDGTIGWPGNSVYYVPAQQTFGIPTSSFNPNLSGSLLSTTYGGIVWYNAGAGTGTSVDRGAVLYKQVVNDDDQYATGSVFNTVISASFEISKSLSNGDRWYVTLYTQSNYPLQTFIEATETDPLFPFNSGSAYDHSEEFSLASQGVYEIDSVISLGSLMGGYDSQLWRFKTGSGYQIPETRPIGIDGLGNYPIGSSLAALVWRANPFPQPVIFEYRSDYFPSGIGEQGGYVIPDDFSNNLKGALFALQTRGVSPVVNNANQVVNAIPSTANISTGAGAAGGSSGPFNPDGSFS